MNISRKLPLALLFGLIGLAHAGGTEETRLTAKDRGGAVQAIAAQRAGDDKEKKAQPDPVIEIADVLAKDDPPDRFSGAAHKVHVVKLQAGKSYLVSMSRKDNKQPFYPWLRIEDSAFQQIVPGPNRFGVVVRIKFTPPKDGDYRIIATCRGGQGEYILRIGPDDAATAGLDEDGFLQRWLMLAPIKLAANESGAVAIDNEQIKNEAKLQPRAGQAVKVGDKVHVWKEIVLSDFLLDFNNRAGRTEDAVAYAVTYIVAPEELKGVTMWTGSDDQLKVYLNGKEVMKFTGTRAAGRDQDRTEVTLHKGVNVLVCKVVNEKGDWGLCVRFADRNNQSLTHLKCKTEK